MSWSIVWDVFSHFLLLSLFAVGGAITTIPEMHRYLVLERSWLDDAAFNASIALAQGAPGPNVLFVGLLGWQSGIGMEQGGYAWWMASACMLAALGGMILPSSALTLTISRWLRDRQHYRGVKAFKMSLAPVALGMLFATAWLLVASQTKQGHTWAAAWGWAAIAMLIMYRGRIHVLWILAAGGALGALGWI